MLKVSGLTHTDDDTALPLPENDSEDSVDKHVKPFSPLVLGHERPAVGYGHSTRYY